MNELNFGGLICPMAEESATATFRVKTLSQRATDDGNELGGKGRQKR
jgi:hypothetical protein